MTTRLSNQRYKTSYELGDTVFLFCKNAMQNVWNDKGVFMRKIVGIQIKENVIRHERQNKYLSAMLELHNSKIQRFYVLDRPIILDDETEIGTKHSPIKEKFLGTCGTSFTLPNGTKQIIDQGLIKSINPFY